MHEIISGASDNLEVEAVSEAASTHSVSSSIELEDQNDNLSDMLSGKHTSIINHKSYTALCICYKYIFLCILQQMSADGVLRMFLEEIHHCHKQNKKMLMQIIMRL